MQSKLQDYNEDHDERSLDDHRLELYTICLGRWRLLDKTDIVLEDITFKSSPPENKRLFAPPNFKIITDYKTGKISPCEYKVAYLDKIDRSSNVFYNEWIKFLTRHDKIALACYCSDPDVCHRTLLAKYLVEFGQENDIEVIYNGEITNDGNY